MQQQAGGYEDGGPPSGQAGHPQQSEAGWGHAAPDHGGMGKGKPYDRSPQPMMQLPPSAAFMGGVPPVFLSQYTPGGFLPLVAPGIPGFEAAFPGMGGLGPMTLSSRPDMMPQPGMMQGMDAFFTGHESVRELVSQLMLPSGVFERQDRRHAMLDTVLHRYEDKEREVEALKKRVEDLESRLHSAKSASPKVAGEGGGRDQSLRLQAREQADSKDDSAAELNTIKTLLLETASKHFPDVCPVKVMGEVTTEEIQRALTGYISKKTLEEAGTTVDEALRDRRFDPFQRNKNGVIVGDNYEHECLTPILTKFGKKLVRLLVCKKREIELYCDKKLTPRPMLWDHERELRVSEVVERMVNALHTARTAHLPPVATTSSGRRVNLNPRLLSSGDLGIVNPPSSSSATASAKAAQANGVGGVGGAAAAPRAQPGLRGMLERAKPCRRPRAPHVLSPVVRHAFIRYMKQNSSMNDASVSMFSGAANSLIYRVLCKKHGPTDASHKNLTLAALRDLMNVEAELFLAEVRGSYANLPRIWKLLQGFIAQVKPEALEAEEAGAALLAEGEDLGIDDYDEDMEVAPEEEGAEAPAPGPSKAVSSVVAAVLAAASAPPRPPVEAWKPLPEDSDDDINDDIDCRGIIFGLPPEPVRKPRLSRGRGPRGLLQGRGPRKSAPGMLSEDVLRGFLGWMKSNTANRGDSLTTIQRAVNTFLARTLPQLTGEDLSRLQLLNLNQLHAMVDALQMELDMAVIHGTNNSLRTFWRHFLSFLRDASSGGLDNYVAMASDAVPASGTQRRGYGVMEPGAPPVIMDPAAPGATPAAAPSGSQATASASASLDGATGGSSEDSGEGSDSGMNGSETGTISATKPPAPLTLAADRKKPPGLPLPTPAPAAVSGAMGGGGGPVKKSKKRLKPDKAGPDAAAGPPRPGQPPVGVRRGGGIVVTTGNVHHLVVDRAGTKTQRKGTCPSVFTSEVRDGFYQWMQRNTRMQAVSMVTALRTSNRVVATMLERIRGPTRMRELTLAEVRQFIEDHAPDFLTEVYRTSNVSVKTFWRHFVRFVLGDDGVQLFDGEAAQMQVAQHAIQQQQAMQQALPQGAQEDAATLEPAEPPQKRSKRTVTITTGRPDQQLTNPFEHEQAMEQESLPEPPAGPSMLAEHHEMLVPVQPMEVDSGGMDDIVVDEDVGDVACGIGEDGQLLIMDDDDEGLQQQEEHAFDNINLDVKGPGEWGNGSEDEGDEGPQDWVPQDFLPVPTLSGPPDSHVSLDGAVDGQLVRRFEQWLCDEWGVGAQEAAACGSEAVAVVSQALVREQGSTAASKAHLRDAGEVTALLNRLEPEHQGEIGGMSGQTLTRFHAFLSHEQQLNGGAQ